MKNRLTKYFTVLTFLSLVAQMAVYGQQDSTTAQTTAVDVSTLFRDYYRIESKVKIVTDPVLKLQLLDSAIYTCDLINYMGKSKELALQYQVEALEKYADVLLQIKASNEKLKSNYHRMVSALDHWMVLDHTIEKGVKLAGIYEKLAALEEGRVEGLEYMEAATVHLRHAVSQMPEDQVLKDRLERYYELLIWKSLRLNRAKSAKMRTQEAIEKYPSNMRMHVLNAISYFLLKKPAKTEKLISEHRQMIDSSGKTFATIMLRDFSFLEQKGIIPDQMKADAEKIKALLQDDEPR